MSPWRSPWVRGPVAYAAVFVVFWVLATGASIVDGEPPAQAARDMAGIFGQIAFAFTSVLVVGVFLAGIIMWVIGDDE